MLSVTKNVYVDGGETDFELSTSVHRMSTTNDGENALQRCDRDGPADDGPGDIIANIFRQQPTRSFGATFTGPMFPERILKLMY